VLDSASRGPDPTRLRRATSEQAGGRNELAWLLVLDNLIDAGEAETLWLDHVGTRLLRGATRRAPQRHSRAPAGSRRATGRGRNAMTRVGAKGTRTDRRDGSPSTSGRFARWLASWRVAIRIARRDARRYRWRSALIVVMVGLPVLLLTGGITLVATQNVSLAESVPSLMGSAQARIAGDSLSASKVQRLTGGKVLQIFDGYVRITQGDRRPTVSALGIDARDPIARGMTDLVSGRWARTPSEIVVTKAGIAGGLPREGTVTAGPEVTRAGPDGQPRQLRIVGVASAQTQLGMPSLVALPELVGGMSDPQRSSAAFLLGRADPVSWSDVRELGGSGLIVQSREVFQNPPPNAQPDPMSGESAGESGPRQLDLVLLLATACLFIETTLLTGPAFAVSAARQRRSLALAASNGAEARQLRRYVLGQALVLGVVSAAIAATAGVLLALGALTWWKAGHPDFVTGPFEVSWPQVVGVLSCSAVASMVAAWLPARGIARPDIVAVLAGRSGDRKIHRGLPVVGVLLMVGSGVAIIWSVASGPGAVHGPGGENVQSWYPSVSYLVAGAGLVIGCLMVIPALLALVGRLGTPLMLPLRLAARDTARQRGRSTPAVASIMAAVATLTALSIGAASDTRQKEDAYKPSRPMGAGLIVFNSDDADERGARTVLDRFAPQLRVARGGLCRRERRRGPESQDLLGRPGATRLHRGPDRGGRTAQRRYRRLRTARRRGCACGGGGPAQHLGEGPAVGVPAGRTRGRWHPGRQPQARS
jgi:putative ABC transport system permease protein